MGESQKGLRSSVAPCPVHAGPAHIFAANTPGHQSQGAPAVTNSTRGIGAPSHPTYTAIHQRAGPPHGGPVLFIDLVHDRVVRRVEVARKRQRP